MSINKIRGYLYTTAKILGDVNAVKRGKVMQRVNRRVQGKITGRLLNGQTKITPKFAFLIGFAAVLFIMKLFKK